MFLRATRSVCVICVQPLNSCSKQSALIIKSTETGLSALTRADLCGPHRFPKPLSVNYLFREPAVCPCVSTFLPLGKKKNHRNDTLRSPNGRFSLSYF